MSSDNPIFYDTCHNKKKNWGLETFNYLQNIKAFIFLKKYLITGLDYFIIWIISSIFDTKIIINAVKSMKYAKNYVFRIKQPLSHQQFFGLIRRQASLLCLQLVPVLCFSSSSDKISSPKRLKLLIKVLLLLLKFQLH